MAAAAARQRRFSAATATDPPRVAARLAALSLLGVVFPPTPNRTEAACPRRIQQVAGTFAFPDAFADVRPGIFLAHRIMAGHIEAEAEEVTSAASLIRRGSPQITRLKDSRIGRKERGRAGRSFAKAELAALQIVGPRLSQVMPNERQWHWLATLVAFRAIF